ncbi:collagen alpha-2(IV) chain isoform X2 [Eutrema salsugineum]|uniref:collagen alpha-2(IV) chain isoform X2 n=1 Tax=Eutrema salsugineum TaxID=72664 RepID=UPI000CED017E|nr:collagen alpha-2(IV) chain isoform X2 [Eutrema salsugineum]
MKSFILNITLLVALLCLVTLPISTVGLPKIPWPKPSELAAGHYHLKGSGHLTDSKVGWVCTTVTEQNAPPSPSGLLPGFPNIPGLPSIQELPNILGTPNIPGFPNIPGIPIPPLPGLPGLPGLPSLLSLPPLPPFQSVVFSQSLEMENCLTKDGSKTTEKCFSQIFSSWAKKDFVLDKECCEIFVKMDKKCNSHVHTLFNSRFFAPLLQYSCQIKFKRN